MASFSLHRDENFIGGGHICPGSHPHKPRIEGVDDMLGDDKTRLRIFKHSFVDHSDGATGIRFFRWLKQQLDRSFKLVFQRIKNLCRTQQAGHVYIMSAGVHLPGNLRFICHIVFLPDRQGIHVGPEGNAA